MKLLIIKKQKLDKPFKTPANKNKSHAVYIKDNGKIKLIRFGQQGSDGIGKKSDKKSLEIAENFYARHKENIKKGKKSPAYWAFKVKWNGDKLLKLEKKKYI